VRYLIIWMFKMNELILKYCKGTYNKEELKQVGKIFADSWIDPDLIQAMRIQWSLTENSELGEKEKFDKILKKIHVIIDGEGTPLSTSKRFFLAFSKVAAILLMPVLVALFILWQYRQPIHDGKDLQIVSVPVGKVSQITLPDGSKVWLNGGTTLSYDKADFTENQRTVYLEGQGYFEVIKNPNRPFVVKGKEISVKVLGTKFDFSSYKEDVEVSVTLMEGSVLLTNSDEELSKLCFLKPNQQAIVSKPMGKVEVKEVDAKNANQWMVGNLIFDDKELGQIASTLGRQYNVKFQFENENIKHLRFYGRFKKKQSLDEILSVIVSGQSFGYYHNKNIVVFKKTN